MNDIFSLGVIKLQLVKRQHYPITGGEHISEMIAKAHKKSKEIDGRLRRSRCLWEEGENIINLALTCTDQRPAFRPSTSEVLQHLNYPTSLRAKKLFEKLRYIITRS